MGDNNLVIRYATLNTELLCLGFANTAEWHARDQPDEHLNSYEDLAAWAQQAGVFTDQHTHHFLQEAAHRPDDAAMVLAKAIAMREAIYHIFSAIAHNNAPNQTDLATLNAMLQEALICSQIVQTPDGFDWEWRGCNQALSCMLWPVARSAADLLVAGDLNRVGECADDRGCGYLFFDTSRNRSRRWCDMKGCGNRAKVRKHYERQQAEELPFTGA